jgi:hypothetical protein
MIETESPVPNNKIPELIIPVIPTGYYSKSQTIFTVLFFLAFFFPKKREPERIRRLKWPGS